MKSILVGRGDRQVRSDGVCAMSDAPGPDRFFQNELFGKMPMKSVGLGTGSCGRGIGDGGNASGV
jgi:hypothetical protein